MKKIISLFKRDYEGTRLVFNEIVPGAEWVIAGEGIATRKWDGTCCMVRDGKLYRRYDAKQGKTPPAGFEPAQDYDPVTGHMPGWVAIGDGPEDRWHREANHSRTWLETRTLSPVRGVTCELCGPHIQGNPEHLEIDTLIPHGDERLYDAPRDFEGLREYFKTHDIEGIVWWHPDGRMVKIKGKDFGIKRPVLQ